MSNPVKILPNYSYEDWQYWEGKWELIGGIPYAMSPSPLPKHQRIANALGGEFYLQLKACRLCSAYQAFDYKVDEHNILQPDLLVVCGAINKRYLDYPPALVVEILSPSTALKDRHTKFDIYQNQKVHYYVLVSPDKEEVEIFELINSVYRLVGEGHDIRHTFQLAENCRSTIQFAEIW